MLQGGIVGFQVTSRGCKQHPGGANNPASPWPGWVHAGGPCCGQDITARGCMILGEKPLPRGEQRRGQLSPLSFLAFPRAQSAEVHQSIQRQDFRPLLLNASRENPRPEPCVVLRLPEPFLSSSELVEDAGKQTSLVWHILYLALKINFVIFPPVPSGERCFAVGLTKPGVTGTCPSPCWQMSPSCWMTVLSVPTSPCSSPAATGWPRCSAAPSWRAPPTR